MTEVTLGETPIQLGIPLLEMAKKSLWNPMALAPSFIREEFVYDSNTFVFFHEEAASFIYARIPSLSADIDDVLGVDPSIIHLRNPIPFFRDGYLLLTKRRVIRVPVKHIVKNIILRINLIDFEEFKGEFLEHRHTNNGVGAVDHAGTFGTEGGVLAYEDTDLAVENQIESLYFARDSQALRGLSNLARTQQPPKRSPG